MKRNVSCRHTMMLLQVHDNSKNGNGKRLLIQSLHHRAMCFNCTDLTHFKFEIIFSANVDTFSTEKIKLHLKRLLNHLRSLAFTWHLFDVWRSYNVKIKIMVFWEVTPYTLIPIFTINCILSCSGLEIRD
jgi:hypothetical protein